MAVALQKSGEEELASAIKLETSVVKKRLAGFNAGELEIRQIVAFKKYAEIN